MFRLLSLALALAVSAHADPVIVGKTTLGCETKILQHDPIQLRGAGPLAVPDKCADLSGNWQGGCYWAVMKCPRMTELGDCIMPRPDEVYLDNIWTKADLAGEPTYGKHRIHIKQEGCRSLTVTASEKTTLHGVKLDFTQAQSGSGFLGFQRECYADEAKWRRTFAMTLNYSTGARWSSDGSTSYVESDLAGKDRNYGATYRNVNKWRLYKTADGRALRLDMGHWINQRNYDPAAFEFHSPDFGGQICIWKRSDQ